MKNTIQTNTGMFGVLSINQREALMSTKEENNRISREKYNRLLKDRIKLSKMMNKIAQKKAILNCELEVSRKNLKVGQSCCMRGFL